jgi:hypothetical protein
MNRLILLCAPLLCGLALGLAACADEGLYTCQLTWDLPNGDEVVATLDYAGLDNADEAVANCEMEQETHEDRPDDATGWHCDCESDD